MIEGTTPAPEGKTWVCCACGKKSRTKYGFYADHTRASEHRWDESCMLNSALFNDTQLVHDLYGRVIQVLPLPATSADPKEGP